LGTLSDWVNRASEGCSQPDAYPTLLAYTSVQAGRAGPARLTWQNVNGQSCLAPRRFFGQPPPSIYRTGHLTALRDLRRTALIAAAAAPFMAAMWGLILAAPATTN
jgi:hypothetical protein